MISNYQLLKSIISGYWLISPEHAESLHPILAGIFNSHTEFEAKASLEESGIMTSYVRSSRKIGIVNIEGTLTKYDTWCAYGMQTIGQLIKAGDADPSIDAIVLVIDSPGGSLDGTTELGETISATSKPIIAYVSDLAASAGYWLASCCDEIICNTDIAMVGSIGVMTQLKDMREYLSKSGIKIHDIYAPQSTDKNKDYRDAMDGNYDGLSSKLATMAEKFQSVVTSNRPQASKELLTGKTYFAKNVLGTLVDSIGNFDSAIDRAVEMASQKTPIQNSSMPILKSMAAVIGVPSIESVDGSISLTMEQANTINTILDAHTAESAQLAAITAERDTLSSENTSLRSQVESSNARIQELSAPATEPAKVEAQLPDEPAKPVGAQTFKEAFDSASETIKQFI